MRCNFVQSETANRDRSTETAQIQAVKTVWFSVTSRSFLVAILLSLCSSLGSLLFQTVAFSIVHRRTAERACGLRCRWDCRGDPHVEHLILIRFGFSPKKEKLQKEVEESDNISSWPESRTGARTNLYYQSIKCLLRFSVSESQCYLFM